MSADTRDPRLGRGARAILAFSEADKLETRPAFSRLDAARKPLEAERLRAEATELLKPDGALVTGAGETVAYARPEKGLWHHEADVAVTLRDTLQHPDSINTRASAQRLEGPLELGILEASIDTAVTIGAENSIEKMLAHQMAAAHHTAMKLLQHSAAERLQPADVARFTNAAARMMEMFQSGCVTMLKLKTRGTQRIVVQQQQVNVGPGGQAVVAGRLSRGSRRAGRRRKNGRPTP